MGTLIFFGSNERGSRFFSVFSFATFLSTLCSFLMYREGMPIFVSLVYASGALVPTALLLWIYSYTSLKSKSLSQYVYIIVLGLFFALLPFLDGLLIFNIRKSGTIGFETDNGVLFPLYLAYFLIAYLIVLIKLIKKYKLSNNENKHQVKIILIGFSLYGGLSILVGQILPLLGYDKLIDMDVPTSLIFVGFTTYAIIHYKWLNMKIITAEIFAIAIIGISASQIFLSTDTPQRTYNIVVFVILAFFAAYLVKNVMNEVRRKEDLQKLSDQLAIANSKLRQLDKAKSEFISIASHQLRTPLTAIKGFVSLLLEGTYGQVPETQKGALEKVYISNERLVQLVEDLLNISRIESGRMEFDFQEGQIEDLVTEAVNTLDLSAKAKGLYLEWKKPAQLAPKTKIDITKIKEVISNMIDNAIKYTQKGGVTVRMENGAFFDHTTMERKHVLRVIVSDTGIGMEKEDIENIFDKFVRGKEISHYHTDGTGLGMFIAKKVTEAHQGKIWAESSGKGKGSRFILELPVS